MAGLLLAADGHYYRDAKGDVYADAVFNYEFYRRYLDAFDEVLAFGRVTNVDRAPEGKRRADGPGISFVDLSEGRGLRGLLKTGHANKRVIRDTVREAKCVIVRVPGVVGNMVAAECYRQGIPYSIEVVVDPWEYFAPGAHGGVVAPVVRRLWTRQLKKDCLSAVGVSYVTESYLQDKYPCRAMVGAKGCFTSHYSSVDLSNGSFAEPRQWDKVDVLKIVHVANTFNDAGKGHDTLFRTAKLLKHNRVPFELTCIGDGPSMQKFKRTVAHMGIAEHVTFTGRLADGNAVRTVIRHADVFVFPTKAEGLPRVLLEAMAEGVPCLSTPVCGIPEILPPDCLFAPEDAKGFASRLVELKEFPQQLTLLSAKGLETAHRYASSVLQRRRREFYSCVRDSKEVPVE